MFVFKVMLLRLLMVARLLMIFQNNKMGRNVPILHTFLYRSCNYIPLRTILIFLRCRVWMQCNHLSSPNIFIFWAALNVWITIA